MPHYENVPFEVPESWVWCKFQDCMDVRDGTHDSPKYTQEGYPLITSKDFKNGQFDFSKTRYISEVDYKNIIKRSKVDIGDILYSMIGGNIGSMIYIQHDNYFDMAIKNVALFKPYQNSDISTKYIAYFLESKIKEYQAIAIGGAQPFVGLDIFRNTLVPLPPLAEQHRIITEIEKWLALIDQIEQGKVDLQTIIKQTKSKILDLAIHGKLVPQDPNDEPAIKLLKRINPDFTPCDNGHYTQLPDGWTACRLEQVADILDNLRKPINSSERDSRIRNRQIDELYPYYGATGQVGLIDDYIINGNYLLLGEDGAPFLDKNAIKAYSISGKSWVNNHAHILSPKIDFEFLQYSLNQIDYSEYVNGSTRLKLTQTDMRSIKIMLPPLAEQKRIKSKIQILFSQLDLMMESL
ncbi:restriction endonuclease subunit S [Bacteroides fragilis]|jgi:type I restriction enzyme S subunit|uniref:restriction endonuclease subunit S n=1 Tax=Bacteroides fragilis TaxID=817 RepID=UPI003FEE5EFA